MSEHIEKGRRGTHEIASALQGCSCGIFLVTSANVSAPWINFEAGALAKAVGINRVFTLLLDTHTDQNHFAPVLAFRRFLPVEA